MNKIKIKKTGFTILEAIVAISILSLSISGVFSSVQYGLSQTIVAKDEVTAFYLAQEAIEAIKNKRDANQLTKITVDPNTNWLAGITSDCPFNRICSIDATNNFAIVNCGSAWGSCGSNLRQDPNTFLYSYVSGNLTNFRREIQLEPVSGTSNEIIVTVRITWTKGSGTRSFEAKTHLFNWI